MLISTTYIQRRKISLHRSLEAYRIVSCIAKRRHRKTDPKSEKKTGGSRTRTQTSSESMQIFSKAKFTGYEYRYNFSRRRTKQTNQSRRSASAQQIHNDCWLENVKIHFNVNVVTRNDDQRLRLHQRWFHTWSIHNRTPFEKFRTCFPGYQKFSYGRGAYLRKGIVFSSSP